MTTHVFIVGLPRTGTGLMRYVLNASPDVGLGGESRFLPAHRRLGLVRRAGFGELAMPVSIAATEELVDRAVERVYDRRAPAFWRKLAARVSRHEFRGAFAATDRTRRDLLDLGLAYYAVDKRVRGEKTPAHIHSVPTLLAWFPDAKVIHMLRDPRAVYVSNNRKYLRKRLPRFSRAIRSAGLGYELYSSLDMVLEWRRTMRTHALYEGAFPGRYRAFRFEDMVRRPDATIREACEFLDVTYSDAMLDQVVANSSFLPRDAATGFDPAATDRWRSHLHPVIARWFRLWAGGALTRAGYPP